MADAADDTDHTVLTITKRPGNAPFGAANSNPWAGYVDTPITKDAAQTPWDNFKDEPIGKGAGAATPSVPSSPAAAPPVAAGGTPQEMTYTDAPISDEGGVSSYLKEGAQALGQGAVQALQDIASSIGDTFKYYSQERQQGGQELQQGQLLKGAFHTLGGSAGQIFSPAIGAFVSPEVQSMDPAAVGWAGEALPKATGEVPKAPESISPNIEGAQSLGAAATPETAPLPERPAKPFIKEQEDAFHRLRQSATADKLELSQYAENVPEEMQDKGLQEKFYRAKEDPSLQAQFTPREKELYDTYQRPLDKEETDLANEIKNAGFGDDEGYVHRIVKGRAPQFDRLAGDAAADNPIGGYRSLPRTTSSLQERVYHVLEDAKGNRTVVALKDGRLTAVEKGKPGVPLDAELASKDFDEIQPGAKVHVAGKNYTLKQAKTDEIEKATGTEYYKNAMANTLDNIARLRVTARAIDRVRKLKDTPEWQTYTFPVRALERGWNGPKPPENYVSPKMPMFRDTLMDPKLANVIDDFYGRGNRGPLFETLAKINNFAYRSLFWSPIPHGINVTADYIIERGWDWLTPQGLRSLAIDGPKAVHQVVTRGPKYQQMLRDGSGMTSGSLQNSAFYERIAKALGEDIVKNPTRWNPIIQTLGLSKPADMVKMFYDASSRVMFAYGDVLMMQRVMELERKGMSPRAAIADAEKHMANYRMPSEVLGSRRIQQGLSDPLVTAFSRYHYGIWNSVAHMARDLVKGTGKEKFDALGNVFALGAITSFVIPAINHAMQALTGNENAKMRAPGTASIPASLIDMYNGDKEFPQFIQNTITLAPLLQSGLEALDNHDYFGRNIIEPDDVRKGNVKAAVGQEAEHVAGSLVQPYQLLQGAMEGKKTLEQNLRDQALGLTEQDPKSKAKGRKIEAGQARARRKKSRGLIEKMTE